MLSFSLYLQLLIELVISANENIWRLPDPDILTGEEEPDDGLSVPLQSVCSVTTYTLMTSPVRRQLLIASSSASYLLGPTTTICTISTFASRLLHRCLK